MQVVMQTGMRVSLILVALWSASAVTPIEKVVGLLKDLQAKVEKEGAKEAVQYEKYACFCKKQAELKKSAIAKSDEKIEVLKADIEDLEASISSLNSDIQQLGEDIDDLQADIKAAVEKREEDHAAYLAKAKDLNEAIDSCGEAIEALKGSKKAMSGADLDLAQLKTAAFDAKVTQTPEAMTAALSLVRTAKRAAQEANGEKPGAAASFKYQSNDIIATIEELQATFKRNKMDMDTEEYDVNAIHEKKVLGWTNDETFKTKEKKEKTVEVEEKTEAKTDAEQSKDETTTDKGSDNSFLETLEDSCEQKAKDWDQRSKARAEEMTALAQATETLEGGALTRYSVNKKLTGLVKVSPKDIVKKVDAEAKDIVKDSKPATKEAGKKAPSFLQLRNVGSSQAAAIQRLVARLDKDASRIQSPVLVAMAVKVQQQADHFSNVRALIKDLIKNLEDAATAEAETKGFCDTEMAKALGRRDKGSADIEEANGIIAQKTALAEAKTLEIKTLGEEIAELHEGILQAKELRAEEKLENAATVEEAKAGAAAVKSALTTLKGFYGLVQTAYKPPKSDRYGETVADAAPESFSGEYKGMGDSAKGILGILEVIQTDFERTESTTKTEETDAAEKHDEYLKKANADIKEKEGKKSDAKTAKENAESAIVDAKDDLNDAENLHAAAEAELEKLNPMCVAGTETYAERVAKRQEEIAALKDAFKILDDWKN